MNEKRAGLFLRQIEHIRGHLWHIYSLKVNQVVGSFLKSNSLLQNVLLGTITEQATCSNPHNDWSSLSITFSASEIHLSLIKIYYVFLVIVAFPVLLCPIQFIKMLSKLLGLVFFWGHWNAYFCAY